MKREANMALTSEFKDAVQNQNKVRVRIMLKDSLLIDPSGDDFQQMLDYAKVQMPSLMDEHNGEVFKTAEQWDETYLNEQMVAVVNNFSEDRIELLQNMVFKLYEPQQSTSHTEHTKEDREDGLSSMQKTGVAVAGVGAVAIVAGVALKTSMAVPIVGGVAIVAGGALYFAGKDL